MSRRKLLLLLISVAISLLFLPSSFSVNPGHGLDNSWQIAVNEAVSHHLIFGEQFVFTYGPLGFLWTRLSLGIPAFVFLLFDVFVIFNVVVALYLTLNSTRLSFSVPVIAATVIAWQGDIANLLLVLFVFLLFEFAQDRKRWLLANLIVMAGLMFFIKLSTGLVPLVLLMAVLGYGVISGNVPSRTLIEALIGYSALIFVGAIFFEVSLVGYLQNGLSIISGYSDAMYLDRDSMGDLKELEKGILCALAMIIPFFIYFKVIFSNKWTFLLYIVIFACLLVFFKVAFTRMHDEQFFGIIIPLAGVLVLFTRVEQQRLYYYTLLPVIVICSIYAVGNEARMSRIFHYSNFLPWQTARNYVNQVANHTGTDPHYEGNPKDFTIPQVILDSISKHPVDIMPVEISYLTRNKLNYTPRPVPQSYSAYTTRLEKLNAKFIGESGPKFLVVSPASVDDRYPMFDEALTKLELLKHYKTVRTRAEWNHFLLERIDHPLDYSAKTIADERYSFTDTIKLATTDDIQLAYPKISYSMAGHLFRILFWAPRLNVTFILKDGKSYKYKCIKPLDECGLVFNKFVYPNSNGDYELFVDYMGQLNRNTAAVIFSPVWSWAFRDNYSVRIDQVTFTTPKVPPREENKPIEVRGNLKGEMKGKVALNFEAITVEENRIHSFGWTFMKDSTRKDVKPVFLLIGKDHYLLFPLQRSYRTDVREVFGKVAGDSTGFSTIVFRNTLKDDIYKVGIAYVDKKNIPVDYTLVDATVDNRKGPQLIALRELSFGKNTIERDFPIGIEQLKISRKVLRIGGWATLNEKHTDAFDSVKIVFRSFNGELFAGTPDSFTRKDVAEYLKNEKITNAGIQGNFSLAALPNGTYDIGILIVDSKTGKGSYRFFDKVNIAEPILFEPIPFTGTFRQEELAGSIDQLQEEKDEFKIMGWAATSQMKADGGKISILLKPEEEDDQILISPTSPLRRKDVTAYYQNKFSLDESGYEATISKKTLKAGRYRIGILIIYPGETIRAGYFTDRYIEKGGE